MSRCFLGSSSASALLKRRQNLIPNGDRVREAFESWGEFFEFRVSEITEPYAGRSNQKIVGFDHADPVYRIKTDDALFLINTRDLPKHHSCILLFP